MKSQSFGPIRQVAWVVRNLEDSVHNWLRVSGVGPWTCFRNVAMAGTLDGQPARVRMHVALGYQGDMEIELIEDLGAGASPYRSPAGEPLVGMHHVAWFSDDVARDVARGARVACGQVRGRQRGHARGLPGGSAEPRLLFEFIEMNEAMRAGFAARLEASRTWQGENPLQVIDLGG
jgi:hypothetical protein